MAIAFRIDSIPLTVHKERLKIWHSFEQEIYTDFTIFFRPIFEENENFLDILHSYFDLENIVVCTVQSWLGDSFIIQIQRLFAG